MQVSLYIAIASFSCIQCVCRNNGQFRTSQQSSLYATVGPPRHQPATTVTLLGDADTMNGYYDMPMDVHVDVGVAMGRDSNVYEVPHDVLDDMSQLYTSRSSSGYETVTRIRARLAGQGTGQSDAESVSPSLLMDSEETVSTDSVVARGYETPQSFQERYSRELAESAQGDSEEDDSTGYEVRTSQQSHPVQHARLCSMQHTALTPCTNCKYSREGVHIISVCRLMPSTTWIIYTDLYACILTISPYLRVV